MRFLASRADAGRRLDVRLAEELEPVTRSQIRKWIDLDKVTVNGAVARAGHALREGDEVAWEIPEADPDRGPEAEDIPVPIVYRDDDLVVVDKPPGLVVHPGAGVRSGTLVSALKGLRISLAPLGGPDRPGIIHRLDRSTSGLLIVARTDVAFRALQKAIAAREIHRHYVALVWGEVGEESGEIEGDIARSRSDRRKMTVVRKGGRTARTRFRVRRRHGLVTLLDLELDTGRTHQIRVHWRHRGHPVFGDPDYGGRSRQAGLVGEDKARAKHWLSLIRRQALHATRLTFDHPVTGEFMDLTAPPPADMQRLLDAVFESP